MNDTQHSEHEVTDLTDGNGLVSNNWAGSGVVEHRGHTLRSANCFEIVFLPAGIIISLTFVVLPGINKTI